MMMSLSSPRIPPRFRLEHSEYKERPFTSLASGSALANRIIDQHDARSGRPTQNDKHSTFVL